MRVSAILPIAIFGAHGANAFFRMGCSNPVVVERADPIVTPGAVSGHLHTVLGGNAFNFNQSYADTRKASCSTCQAKADLSNYWTPVMYYQAKDGSFQSVDQIGGGTVYYLQRYSQPGQRLLAYPEGFRMLAGSPALRSFDNSSLEQQAVSFVCLDYAGSGAGGQWPYFPAHNCPNGVRAQVFFPSCWDGKNVDSTDHKSHMAYPDRMDSGICPDSHPVRMISIFYEITFDTNKFKDMWYGSKQPFVLSNGDPTGYGFHGDFLNGWDVPSLQIAVDQCTQQSGVIEDCQNVLPLRTDEEMNDCVIAPRVPEVVVGKLAALPGCNSIQSGPGNAVAAASCTATKSIMPATSPSMGYLKTDIPGWVPVGCARDDGPNRLLPNRFTNGNMTVEGCLAHCKSTGMQYAGLQWAQECWCGNSLNMSAVGNYACTTPCEGDASEYCGGSLRDAVYKQGTNVPPATTATTAKPATTTANPATTTAKQATTTAKPVTTTAKPATTTAKPATTTAKPVTTAKPPATTQPIQPSTPKWTSMGCWYDPVKQRALRGTARWTGGGKGMTPALCQSHCAAGGFEYAGVEYGVECFCGNTLYNSFQTYERECGMACAGDKSKKCGAGYRMDLYKASVNKERDCVDQSDDAGTEPEATELKARGEPVQLEARNEAVDVEARGSHSVHFHAAHAEAAPRRRSVALNMHRRRASRMRADLS